MARYCNSYKLRLNDALINVLNVMVKWLAKYNHILQYNKFREENEQTQNESFNMKQKVHNVFQRGCTSNFKQRFILMRNVNEIITFQMAHMFK